MDPGHTNTPNRPGPDGERRQPVVGPFTPKTAAKNDQVERLDRATKGLPRPQLRKALTGDDRSRQCRCCETDSVENEVSQRDGHGVRLGTV
jgi:hypothetical protein